MPTFLATAAAPGDLGPAQTLLNKDCATVVTVTFSGVLTLTPGAGDYTADANWEVFGPDGTTITSMSGPNKDTVAQTFTPDIPGRYLVELNATFFDDGLSYRYTALVEVKDSQLRDTSAPAANEVQEYDADQGWSISLQKSQDTAASMLNYKQLVSVTSAGSVLGDNTVTPMMSDAWLAQWKSATVDFESFKNYSVEVEAVTKADAEVQDQPIFLMLHEVDGTDPNLEKGYALLRGATNYDTTTIAGAPAAGVVIYVNDGANTFTTVKPAGGPPYPRYVGRIIQTGAANGASPGVIYFDGTASAFFSDVFITGKLTVDGLIDPIGLEFEPTTSNPGAVPANTLWLDRTAADVLRWGANEVLTAASSVKVIATPADPTINDDSAAGGTVGDVWVNTADDTVFVAVDVSVGAAVWSCTGTRSTAANPTATDDDTLMYIPGDTWFNTATGVSWVCMDNTTATAIWLRTSWETIAISADPAPAEHYVHYLCSHVGPFTVTLPPVGTSNGVRCRVTNNDTTPWLFTVDGAAAETIVGAPTYLLPVRYDTVTLTCDGTEWFVE